MKYNVYSLLIREEHRSMKQPSAWQAARQRGVIIRSPAVVYVDLRLVTSVKHQQWP